MVFFHRRLLVRLGLVAGADIQGFMIIERNRIQYQLFQRWMRRAQQRFGATCALLRRQPDHRWPLRIGGGFGDTPAHAGRQPQRGCDADTEFHETAPRDTTEAVDETVELGIGYEFCFGCLGFIDHSCTFLKRLKECVSQAKERRQAKLLLLNFNS